MSGTIIENLSGRKLSVLVSVLLLVLLGCFLIGGLMAPMPAGTQMILGSVCKDPKKTAVNETDDPAWFYVRGEGKCAKTELVDVREGDSVVFAFQMPTPKENVILDYSRWQQNLIGLLQLDIRYAPGGEVRPRIKIRADARLGYRNRGDADGAWKPYARSVERRNIDCELRSGEGTPSYVCSPVPLFELGSLHHDYYLLNLRFPPDQGSEADARVGRLGEVWLITINQNGGFTKVWLSLKTIFFPVVLAATVWFRRRINALEREPVIVERTLTYLAAALCALNAPLEYLTLAFDMPFMLLLGDVRQGIFYAALLSFWLVFAGEHMLVREPSEAGDVNSLKRYRAQLSAVGAGCASLFLFDACERGVQLRNPFYSIWVTDLGTNLALTFIVSAGISAGLYFVFLCATIWKVFRDISHKRSSLPAMHSARRLHYEGIIYRFKFVMLATVACAALTVVGFVLGQVDEGHWKWDENIHLEFTSAFFTGVYGMWNVYTLALLALYAPSRKRWPSADDIGNLGEEMEFSRLPSETSPSEISSLTSFVRKTTID